MMVTFNRTIILGLQLKFDCEKLQTESYFALPNILELLIVLIYQVLVGSSKYDASKLTNVYNANDGRTRNLFRNI